METEETMDTRNYKTESDRDAVLGELLAQQKKLVFQARLSGAVNLVLGIAVVLCLVLLLPRARAELTHIESSLTAVDALVADAEVLIENANTMVTDNTEAVTETVQKLNEVDFDGLNDAIGNLNDAIAPLASFAGLFQR